MTQTIEFLCEIRHGNSTYFGQPTTFTLEIQNETICSQFVYIKGNTNFTYVVGESILSFSPIIQIVMNSIGTKACPYLEKVIVFTANDTTLTGFSYTIDDWGRMYLGTISPSLKLCKEQVHWRFKVPAPAPILFEYIRSNDIFMTICNVAFDNHQLTYTHPVVF